MAHDAEQPAAGSGPVREPWQLSVARKLGSAARRASSEVESLAAWARDTLVGATAPPPRPRRPAQPLPVLLRQLAELLAAHAETDFKSARQDARLWLVVRRLHERRPRATVTTRRRRAVTRQRPTPVRPREQRLRSVETEPRPPSENTAVDQPAAADDGEPKPTPSSQGEPNPQAKQREANAAPLAAEGASAAAELTPPSTDATATAAGQETAKQTATKREPAAE
jgi:hypothetical protein